jgi:hypothetical protein
MAMGDAAMIASKDVQIPTRTFAFRIAAGLISGT